MLIEALSKLIKYRWPDGEVQLKPGHPVDLPEDRALKLLARAQGKVRLVEPGISPSQLGAGRWVEYASPLFGRITCEVLDVGAGGELSVFHPLQAKLVTIPLAWVVKVLQRAPERQAQGTGGDFRLE